MRPHRPPPVRSGTFSRCVAHGAPMVLVLLVALCSIQTLTPAAAAKRAGQPEAGRAGTHGKAGAPGQAKKAAASKATMTVLAAVVAQAAQRLAVTQPTTRAKTKTRTKAKTKAKAKGKRPVSAAREAEPPVVITPAAAVIPATAPGPAAAPAPVPAAVPAPATPASTTAAATRRVRSGSAAARRTPPRRAATTRSAAAATAPAATAPERPDARLPARPREAPRAGESPLTRTVVRVLEVVPPELRIALAALAGLGLLLAAATAVQTVRRGRLARQRGRLLADVGVLQSALLPRLPERIGGARVSAAYRPAEGLAAGGDFYDAFELPGGRTGVLVGDVAGHGREVVPLTALVRYNVRAYLEAGLPPRAAVHVAANVLAPHLGDLQVTIVVAIFDAGTGRLTYACAGHAPPLLLADTTAPVTACSSPPLGAGAPTGRRQTTVAFAPGAVACFHTDGLDEAPLAYGRLGRDGVAEALTALGAQRDADQLIARVVRRSERQPDDMAACIVTALPGGAGGWSLRLEELEVDATTLSSGWAQRFLIACGVEHARIARALREAHAIVARDGTAVIEVRVGDTLADVRVTPPPAVTLPIAARPPAPVAAAAAG